MRAVVASAAGGPEVLSVREVADPVAGPEEVLVRVHATAVNRADLLQRAGNYPPPPGASQILGLECSGTILAIGAEVTGWNVGDPVCALLAGGGYAELVAVPATQLMPLPDGIGLTAAAALPEVACTVWSTVFDHADLRAGESFLVHGGSSGIGTMAIQLAAAAGATVFATAGTERKRAACRELGAQMAIDYTGADFDTVVTTQTEGRGVDVILDNIGAKYLTKNLSALATGGRLVVIGMQGGAKGELDLAALMAKRASIYSAGLRARPKHEKAAIVAGTQHLVWPLIAAGAVRPVIDRVLPLAEVADAHRLVDASTHIGKVVLTLD